MKNMLSNALREIRGLWNQLLKNLEGEQGEEWLVEFKKFLRKEKCWTNTLLEFIEVVKVIATTKKFIARKEFAKDTSAKAEVKISGRGNNFDAWFMDKVEDPIRESELCVHKLRKGSVDGPIIVEIGGSTKAKVFLAQIKAFMKKKQDEGETDGWYVAYVEDEVRFPEDEPFAYINEKVEKFVLRAVRFRWRAGGWRLTAHHVSYPDEWYAGYQILSSNSSETKS